MSSHQMRLSPPKVSICIPTYNGRDHLKECLDGVRAQTFTDFEVLICDDQSSDGTLDFARELAAGDPRFRFIPNPKRFGLVGNWNNCIAQSRGEWVKFVFQDDIIAPACVEKLFSACEKTGKLFSFCARDFIFDESVPEDVRAVYPSSRSVLDTWYQGKDSIEITDLGAWALANPQFNPVGEPTVTLIQKSVFRDFGLFDGGLIQLCDSEFSYRVLSNTGAAWVPARLATFRVHRKSTTAFNRDSHRFRADDLDSLIILYRFAFDPAFLKLRSERKNGLSEYSFRKECAKAAYRVKLKARRVPGEDLQLARNRMKEWDAVAGVYPRLNWLAKMGLAVQICHPVKKTVTGILATCGLVRSR